MTVVNLKSFEEARQEKAWAEYVELANKAQKTQRLDDAIAAGKAWSRFVYLFCPRSTR